MNFRDAIKRSVTGFYNGQLPDKAIEASEEEFKYTLDYFEDLEEEELEGDD
jgi:hypothetical protein